MKHGFVLGLLWLVAAGGEVQAQAVITVGEYPPFFTEHQANQGLASQLVVQAFAREGIRVKVEFYPWSRALEMAKSGLAAASAGWTATEARKQDFLFSEPFYTAADAVLVRQDSRLTVKEIEDLRGKRVGVIMGYAYGTAFDDSVSKNMFTVDLAQDAKSNLAKLLGQRVDAIVLNRAVAVALLRGLPAADRELVAVSPADLNRKPWAVAVGRAAPQAEATVAAFNAGLAKMKKDGSWASLVRALNDRQD